MPEKSEGNFDRPNFPYPIIDVLRQLYKGAVYRYPMPGFFVINVRQKSAIDIDMSVHLSLRDVEKSWD